MSYTNIYILIDPISNEIRYVGKANNIQQRLHSHKNRCRDANTHKRHWINKLRLKGLHPELEVIDRVLVSEWHYWEKFWISYYLSIGCRLTNSTYGGDGLSFGNNTSFKKGQGAKPVVELNMDCCVVGNYKSVSSLPSGESSLNKKGKITIRNTILLYKDTFDKMTIDELKTYISDGMYIRSMNEKKRIENSIKKGGFKKGKQTWNKGKKYRNFGIPVYQYDRITGNFINEYKDSTDASAFFYCSSANIQNCARMVSKTAAGFIWRYYKKENVPPVTYKSNTWNTINNKINKNEK
jgi:hypothetical protein